MEVVKGVLTRLAQAASAEEADLQSINLSGKLAYEGGEDHVKKLAAALQRTKAAPTLLDLSSNQLGDKAGRKLAKLISGAGGSLERVLLHDNAFGPDALDALLKALGSNLRITHLTIDGQANTSEKEAKRIARHVKRVLASTAEFHKAIEGKSANVNLLGRGLAEVPAAFMPRLTHLTVLNLNHNKLRSLPEELALLTRLEELRLAENRLEVVPGWVSRMAALQIIDLRYNERLLTLPLGLARLGRLECLEFGANKQDQLKRLQVLRESRYSAASAAAAAGAGEEGEAGERGPDQQVLIPQEIVRHGGRDIIAWLRELERGEKLENRFKVMVVGAPGVGKTLLAEWLFQRTKMESRNIDAYVPAPTHGVTRTWAELKRGGKSHHAPNAAIACCYDCGGEDMGHEFMLTARTCYVVVFDITKPDEEHSRLEYWLKRIGNSVESPVPIVVVATHADDRSLNAAHKKKVSQQLDRLKEAHPALRDFFIVNARLGKGVEEVRNKLVEVAADYYWLAQPVPKSYLALSAALIDLNVPSLEDQVIANCADLGPAVPAPENVIPALAFLADLGLVVYTRPLVTLEPLWMSEALGEAMVSVETKIAREVPLLRPVGDQEIAAQLSSLGAEARRLEKEFALLLALLDNKAHWPKEEDLGQHAAAATKRKSVVPKLKLGS